MIILIYRFSFTASLGHKVSSKSSTIVSAFRIAPHHHHHQLLNIRLFSTKFMIIWWLLFLYIVIVLILMTIWLFMRVIIWGNHGIMESTRLQNRSRELPQALFACYRLIAFNLQDRTERWWFKAREECSRMKECTVTESIRSTTIFKIWALKWF